jgi:hypothetical protein
MAEKAARMSSTLAGSIATPSESTSGNSALRRAAAESADAASRLVTATFQPSAANLRAMAYPVFFVAPVTTKTFFPFIIQLLLMLHPPHHEPYINLNPYLTKMPHPFVRNNITLKARAVKDCAKTISSFAQSSALCYNCPHEDCHIRKWSRKIS